jgi:hypothetical protein
VDEEEKDTSREDRKQRRGTARRGRRLGRGRRRRRRAPPPLAALQIHGGSASAAACYGDCATWVYAQAGEMSELLLCFSLTEAFALFGCAPIPVRKGGSKVKSVVRFLQ